MPGLSGSTIAIACGVGGLLAGWALAAARSRVLRDRLEEAWADRFRNRETELARANQSTGRASRESQRLRVTVATSEQTVANLERELRARTTELEALKGSVGAASLTGQRVEDALELAGAREAPAGELEQRLEDVERELRVTQDQLRLAGAALEKSAMTRNRLEADRTRLELQVEALSNQLREVADGVKEDRARLLSRLATTEAARDAGLSEVDRWKQRTSEAERAMAQAQVERDAARAAAAAAATEVARRDLVARELEVAHQARLAGLTTELGSLTAQAERIEPLLRQLEDRDALVLALSHERDEAGAHLLRHDRELRSEIARLEASLRDQQGRESALTNRVNGMSDLESRVAAIGRERDRLLADTRKQLAEIQTLKAELRDRDRRFGALLEDRRLVVERYQVEVARQSRALEAVTNGNHDDLRRITGIGPVLNRELHKLGIYSFQQIAAWTDEDIERVAEAIGTFASRIRREQWVEQARHQHDRSADEHS